MKKEENSIKVQDRIKRGPPILALDFDGPCHQYSKGWQDGEIYDPPSPGLFEALHSLLLEGWEIWIHSSRLHPRDVDGVQGKSWLKEMKEWWSLHRLPVHPNLHFWTEPGKPLAHVYLDDRAVRFLDWGQSLVDVRRAAEVAMQKDPQVLTTAGVAVKQSWLSNFVMSPEQAALDGIRQLLVAIHEDPNRDGLLDTPARVLKAFQEMTTGYSEDPGEILTRQFDVPHDEMIVVKNIEFVSLCEHHLLPFLGSAHLAYIPGESKKVVGLSKLPRLVACFAKRLQVQERMTSQIADAIEEHLQPSGCGVVIEATHSCMSCRGVKQANARMITNALRGAFKDQPQTRNEFLELVRSKQ